MDVGKVVIFGAVGEFWCVVNEGVKAARTNPERNLSEVAINVKILFSWVQVGGVKNVEVPKFVGVVNSSCGGKSSYVFEQDARYGPYGTK